MTDGRVVPATGARRDCRQALMANDGRNNGTGTPRFYGRTVRGQGCQARADSAIGDRGLVHDMNTGPAPGRRPSVPRTGCERSSRPAGVTGYALWAWYRRAGWPGRRRPGAVQQERERVPLRGGERGCCLGQFPDPGIQAAGGVGCGVPVVVVTLVALGWGGRGVGARPACRPGSGFPLRR
jgi:hypothetical protein